MLLWVAFYFGAFLPGHQRGTITLPQGDVSSAAASCPLCPTPPADSDDSGSPAKQTPVKRGGCCAICQTIGTLDTPETIEFDPPFLGLLEVLAVAPVRTFQDLCAPGAIRSRGPPMA